LTRTRNGHPFDGSAPTYDRGFTSTAVGRRQRHRVWGVLDRVFPRRGRFLDLGCGTGEDALWLARRGADLVVGCDASDGMLDAARDKLDSAGLADRAVFHRLDLARATADEPPVAGAFDGAVADFGVLNCLEDRRRLATALSGWLAPGGSLVIVLMGPWCLWEIGWHLCRLRPGTAFRRWRQGREASVDGGGRVRVWYPRPRQLRRELGPCFDHLETVGVGVFVPPSYLNPMVAAHPRLLTGLGRLEDLLGHRRPWAWLADHVLLVLRNTRL
jgi:SAM-dependent methyltransferase